MNVDTVGCKCSLSRNCKTFGKPNACNCDAPNTFNQTDTGILTSMDKLPIFAVSYGGSLTPYSSINYNIGPLVCSGKKGVFPSEADDIEKERIKSRLRNLENELDDHMGLIFGLAGPFRPSKNNKIGEINSYFNNYKFSFEVKHQSIPSGFTQLLNVHSSSLPSSSQSLVYVYPQLDNDSMQVMFWNGGKSGWKNMKMKIDKSQYIQWHKE